MIRIGFDPILESQQRQRELLKEIERYRLISEASESKDSKAHRSLRFLAVIGKEISSFGASLEKHFGGRTQSDVVTNQIGNVEGCR